MYLLTNHCFRTTWKSQKKRTQLQKNKCVTRNIETNEHKIHPRFPTNKNLGDLSFDFSSVPASSRHPTRPDPTKQRIQTATQLNPNSHSAGDHYITNPGSKHIYIYM